MYDNVTSNHPGKSGAALTGTREKSVETAEFQDLIQYLLSLVREKPDSLVVAHMKKMKLNSTAEYDTMTYAEVHKESNRIAHGLEKIGIVPNMHVLFMVTPGLDFFNILTAIFKIGAIPVFVDPGMGIKNLKQCIDEAEPEAFIGIPRAHFARKLLGWARETVKITITVGRRLFWGGYTLDQIKRLGTETEYNITKKRPDDMAMLAFTSGNTGIPKGVVFTHGIFATQLKIIRDLIQAHEGGADLSTFPPFALFGPASGIPSILPQMDFSKPATANPKKLITAINDFSCTNMFASPALINKIGRYGEKKGIKLKTLRRVFSAGAPANIAAIRRFSRMLNDGVQIFTPYGATEVLPVSIIGSDTLLNETGALTDSGSGVCVGHPVSGMNIAIIKITEDPIETWSDNLTVSTGTIGEITVKGPVVTTVYYKRKLQTALAKIYDPKDKKIWHRMGDVGYLDDQGRLWVCGRKAHRVSTKDGVLFPLPCEAIFNNHADVFRSALVGVTIMNKVVPVIIIELEKNKQLNSISEKILKNELLQLARKHKHTLNINTVLFHKNFPVDIRHNAKILREKLAPWAQKKLGV